MITSISIEQMLDLWIDFWLAFTGEHHYGGHVAEIYAYRVEPYNVALHRPGGLSEFRDKLDSVIHYSNCAHALVDMLNEFCRKYDATAKIDGKECNYWLEVHGALGEFDWRCHVEIQPLECKNKDCHDHHAQQ